ncbi:MAG: patatin-like phospholipase family protein [Trueperaceae bacterium]
MPRLSNAPPKTRPATDRRPKIGLVLSGGGARGFAHIGVLRVLERHGVEVDALAGTSMGAILAALHAHGYRADDLHELAASVSWRDVIDLSLSGGVVKGEKLHQLLATYLPARFEDLGKTLAVTCTDIEAGEQLVFTSGDLITPVRASACLPGAFEPVEYQGRTLADGGILNNLPVDALALVHTDLTLASDVSPPRRAVYEDAHDGRVSWWQRVVATVTLERRTPLAAATFRAADIMMRLLTDAQYIHHPADLRIQHEMPGYRLESFWALDEIVALGEAEAEAELRAHPALLERLQAASSAPSRRRRLPPPPDTGAARASAAPAEPDEASSPGERAPGDAGRTTMAEGSGEASRSQPTESTGESIRTLWSHLRRG